MSRSYPYTCKYSTELECIVIYGVSEGKKFFDDFDRHANLKYKYGNRNLGCRGYYVNTVSADTHAITAYIQNQLAEDHAMEQMRFKEYIDPFTGSKNK